MLELINIGLSLQDDSGSKMVLDGINLKLRDKKIYVMTGPNGGGKSSIAKTVMGIYKPTCGQILLDGEDITGKEIYERARLGLGYAFQQPARFKGVTVRDLLSIAAKDHEIDYCALLYDVGLCAQDYLDREVNSSLSGGEVKRIEIATILARKLKAAIFDEPEAGIDLWSFQKLTEIFETMHEKYDTTLVVISHQERILNLADEVIIVTNGTIGDITSREKILGEISELDSACRCRKSCQRSGRADAGCDR
jgi:Fe-S cluster assembly ATP-binding protein